MRPEPSPLREAQEQLRSYTRELTRLKWMATALSVLLLLGGIALLARHQLEWFHYR